MNASKVIINTDEYLHLVRKVSALEDGNQRLYERGEGLEKRVQHLHEANLSLDQRVIDLRQDIELLVVGRDMAANIANERGEQISELNESLADTCTTLFEVQAELEGAKIQLDEVTRTGKELVTQTGKSIQEKDDMIHLLTEELSKVRAQAAIQAKKDKDFRSVALREIEQQLGEIGALRRDIGEGNHA
jgi:chromosome segregation ATPase